MKRNRILLGLGLAATALSLGVWATRRRGPIGNRRVPEPAKAVDLERYLGRWYELGRYENRFETGCEAVTADYRLRDDGQIDVRNACRRGRIDAPCTVANGIAKVVPGTGGAKLRVSFFRPFYGNYWVLDHADDYSWSIVGEPSGRYLWMLTRVPSPADSMREAIIGRIRSLGYDTGLIRFTRHPRIDPHIDR